MHIFPLLKKKKVYFFANTCLCFISLPLFYNKQKYIFFRHKMPTDTDVPLRVFDTAIIEKLHNAYLTKETVTNLNGISLFHEPFTHCVLNDFLTNKTFENDLYKEVKSKLKFAQKNNDLYKFKQVNKKKKFFYMPHLNI